VGVDDSSSVCRPFSTVLHCAVLSSTVQYLTFPAARHCCCSTVLYCTLLFTVLFTVLFTCAGHGGRQGPSDPGGGGRAWEFSLHALQFACENILAPSDSLTIAHVRPEVEGEDESHATVLTVLYCTVLYCTVYCTSVHALPGSRARTSSRPTTPSPSMCGQRWKVRRGSHATVLYCTVAVLCCDARTRAFGTSTRQA